MSASVVKADLSASLAMSQKCQKETYRVKSSAAITQVGLLSLFSLRHCRKDCGEAAERGQRLLRLARLPRCFYDLSERDRGNAIGPRTAASGGDRRGRCGRLFPPDGAGRERHGQASAAESC
jgi:hypothetical protein